MLDLLTLSAVLVLAAGDARAPAPAAHCLDARAVSDVWWQSPTQILVATGARLHRVSTATDCPASEAGGALLARDGWVCGTGGEFVQSADQRCPISAVSQLSRSEANRALRDRRHAETELTATPLRKAFQGSVEQCMDPTRMRSWSVDGNDLIVTTARAGATAPTRFRVTLAGSCPEAGTRDVLQWRSATGRGRICGVPGEFAVFSSQHNNVVTVARGFLAGPASADQIGCAIAAVAAIER
jgi:hypothetical protein